MLYKKTLSKIRATTRKMKKLPDTIRKFSYIVSHGLGNAPLPKMIALPITAQCNYRCGFCEIVGVSRMLQAQNRPYHANTLSVGHARRFHTIIRHVRSVDFGGMTAYGEPLLSPHFREILWEIRSLNPKARILLTTNGNLLTPQLADTLIEAAPLHVTFSIHAASEDVYQTVMGSGFAAVIKNLRYFCHQARTFENIKTSINFGLGKLNYTDAEGIVRLAKELGIRTVHMYPYYKSPNKFMEDVSLYAVPEIANNALDAAYRLAESLGQKITPSRPHYLGQEQSLSYQTQPQGRCQLPFENFILKSVPFDKNKIAFCVCNRLVPFMIDLDKKVRDDDLFWLWNHPVLKALRFSQKQIPEICRFCKDPETPRLRSLDHEEYKARRDKAVQEYLARFQECNPSSPNHSVTLLSENIFSIP